VLAQKAFGKAGADLIPVVKQLNGDLAKATETALKMGTALGEDDVRAADELGDALGVLGEQVRVGAAKFALAYAPQITAAIGNISQNLADNQNEWVRWGRGVGDVANGVYNILSGLVTWARNNPIILKTIVLSNPISAAGFYGAQELAKYGAQPEVSKTKPGKYYMNSAGFMQADPVANEPAATGAGGFSAAGRPDLEFDATGGGKGGKGGGGQSAADKAKAEREKAEREEEERRRKAVQAARTEMADKLAIYAAGRANDLALLDQNLANKLVLEKDYIYAVGRINLEALMDERALNKELLQNENLTADERKDIANKIKVLDMEIRTQKIESSTKIIELIKKETKEETEAHEKRLKRMQEISGKRQRAAADFAKWQKDQREQMDPYGTGREKKGAGPKDVDWETTGGGDFLTGLVDGLGAAEGQLSVMRQIGEGLASVFGQVAQAVGAAVKSFVLFGTAGGSFRKFAAEVIASIAQMAVVQAVFELAQGFAMLALTWFTGNPKYAKSAGAHFAAAAAFGIIGGVAAGAGRAVAGDSFKQQTSNGGAGAGAGGGEDAERRETSFTERFNGFQERMSSRLTAVIDRQNAIVERQNTVLGQFEETFHQFKEKIQGISPTDVVTLGAEGASGAIRGAVESELSSDLRAATNLHRLTGAYS